MTPATSTPPGTTTPLAEAGEGAEPAPFDLAGPLPEGLTLIEASAGTGKTFAIAALVARYVAEGLTLDELLVVTFTRAATGELRDRVRRRLLTSLEVLDRHLADGPPPAGRSPEGTPPPAGDPLDAVLTAGTPADVERRRDHIAAALAEFDRATIVTTHAFCHEMLQGLGTAGDVARDVTFLEDDGDLLGEVVDDFYVRKFARQVRRPEFDHATAAQIARSATQAPGLELEPKAARPDSEAALRFRFATNVRLELTRRKQLANTFSYDDVLRSLADSLESPDGIAAARLRDRFRVVLVDEFQDTDPTQWQILESAFLRPEPRPGAAVVLVGDPKQAIYSFRGADVFTYLDAARTASRRTLSVNWRSDAGLVEGLDALLDGAALGHPGIRCRPVRPAPDRHASSLSGPATAPIRLRLVAGNDTRLVKRSKGGPTVDSIRALIAEDLAGDVARLLASGTDVALPAGDGPAAGRRKVAPGDIAVLVRTNRAAATIRRALELAGIPAVIHGGENVFDAPVALDWLQLLEALERPTSAVRARAAALSAFVGWDAGELASAPDAKIGALQADLHEWAAVLEHQGVGALVEAITLRTRLPVRLLGEVGGERRLTDLVHIGELLHAEAIAGHLGPAALAAWLRRRMEEGDQTPNEEERSRRLESDADAVAVLTIHRSKGLEFPVVYLPDLSESDNFRGRPTYHDPDTGRRTLDVGDRDDPANPDYQRHQNLYEEEQRGEELRLAYVALTRARHQVVCWWGPFQWQSKSPLTRLLLADRDRAGAMHPRAGSTEPAVRKRLATLESATAGGLAVEAVATTSPAEPWRPTPGPAADELGARLFDRTLDVGWRRTSYTALTAAAYEASHGGAVGSEAEDAPDDDELPVDLSTTPTLDDDATERALRAEASPMADLGKGPAFGVLVHSVLETVAFDDPDLGAALGSAIRANTRFGRVGGAAGGLADALTAVIDTPLGNQVGNLRLRDLSRSDRLDELGFELPLAGGDTPGARVGTGDVAALLRERLAPDDPLAGYAERLDDPALDAVLRGYLTGSIDLLLRVRGPEAERFVVVDYKTNWLAPAGEALSAWHYRPAALADAMIQAHYPLQALLYSVALHRYLRWRLPAYTPEAHLGPVLYLFLRGMSGPMTPVVAGSPCGVFAWQPPPGLVSDLSDLLDGSPS